MTGETRWILRAIFGWALFVAAVLCAAILFITALYGQDDDPRGHYMGPPDNCTQGQTISWDATAKEWVCANAGAGGGGSFTCGAPALILSTTNGAGVSAQAVCTDSTIQLFSAATPANLSDTAAAGAINFAARTDHVHDAFDGTLPADLASTASTGAILFSSRADHVHAFPASLKAANGDLWTWSSDGTTGNITTTRNLRMDYNGGFVKFSDDPVSLVVRLESNRGGYYFKGASGVYGDEGFFGAENVAGTQSMYFDSSGDLFTYGAASRTWNINGQVTLKGTSNPGPGVVVGHTLAAAGAYAFGVATPGSIVKRQWATDTGAEEVLHDGVHWISKVPIGVGKTAFKFEDSQTRINGDYLAIIDTTRTDPTYHPFAIKAGPSPQLQLIDAVGTNGTFIKSDEWAFSAVPAAPTLAKLRITTSGPLILLDNTSNDSSFSLRTGIYSSAADDSFQEFWVDRNNVAQDGYFKFWKNYADDTDENDLFQILHSNATVGGNRRLFAVTVGSRKGFWISKNFELGMKDLSGAGAYDGSIYFSSDTNALTSSKRLKIDLNDADRTLRFPFDAGDIGTGTLAVARGGTNLSSAADDNVMVGNGTTWESKAVPNCDDVTGKLDYDTATNAWSCQTDAGGGGGGDNVRVEDGDNAGTFTASSDADFEDSGDINFVLDTAPSPDQITGLIRANAVALTTDTTGDYIAAITGGTGISASAGGEGATVTIDTASTEENFLASGALTCGAGTRGKMQVHTTPLQYCDNAATPALQYAAYGDSSGNALAGDSATAFFSAGTIDEARLDANVVLDNEASTWASAGSQVFNDPVEVKPDGTNGVTVSAGGLLAKAGTGSVQADDVACGASCVSNAEVDNDITLTNITQITNRAFTDLSASCTDAQVVGGNAGATALECQTDDDIPDAGDFTNLSLTGPITTSGGVATTLASTVGGRSLTVTANVLDADVELYEQTKCMTIENPVSGDDFLFWRVERAVTVTGIDCLLVDGTSVATIVNECNTTGTGCTAIEASISCTPSGASESGGIDNADLDATDWIRIDPGTVSGTVTQMSVCVTYTVND